MEPHPYRFANEIWVDIFVDNENLARTALRLIPFSLAPWLLGFLIALIGGYQRHFLETPAFYIGSFGIFVTMFALAYGSVRQYDMYDRITACFEVSDRERRASIVAALERHSNFSYHLRASLLIFFAGFSIALSSFLWWPDLHGISSAIHTYLPRFRVFELHGWYDDEAKLYGLAIAVVFLAFISPPLGTSASIMLRMPLFLWDISSRTPALPPTLIKAHFSPATALYAKISVLWLIGVALLFYLFGSNKDWLSYSVVVAAFFLGIVNFSLPQITYVRTVSASEDRFLASLSHFFDEEETMDAIAGPASKTPGIPSRRNATDMLLLLQLLRHDNWVYPLHQTYIVIGIYLITLGGSAIDWRTLLETRVP